MVIMRPENNIPVFGILPQGPYNPYYVGTYRAISAEAELETVSEQRLQPYAAIAGKKIFPRGGSSCGSGLTTFELFRAQPVNNLSQAVDAEGIKGIRQRALLRRSVNQPCRKTFCGSSGIFRYAILPFLQT